MTNSDPMELIVDSFAGGGGASLGIAWATGRAPDVAINHDAAAIRMHETNHPATQHYTEDVFRVSPRTVTKGRPVGLLWASPDCKHFSRAKGSKPVSRNIRGLAWVAVKWATEVKPRVIILENVREFQDWGPLVPAWRCDGCRWTGTEGQATLLRGGRRACPRCGGKKLADSGERLPDPKRKGLTFRQFVGRLKGRGYTVAWRVLNAADFGDPTHRRRLFLVARCDGEAINWPEPTHASPKDLAAGVGGLFGDDRKPWRTAAECIDWSVPCPSIFERKKPLAEKTLRRIAMGIKRYVLDNPRPFLIRFNTEKGPGDVHSRDLAQPVGTITADPRFGLVTPVVTPVTHNGERRSHPPTEPFPTITGANRGELAYVAPVVARIGQTNGNGNYVSDSQTPLTTVTSKAEHLLIAPTLIQTGYGEREGQAPRALDINTPLGTVVAGGQKHAVCAAWLIKHYGEVVGVPADTPLPTTTARGTQNQLAVANLVHLNHGEKQWSGLDEPSRTVTTGNHAALVYSFLIKYFGTAVGCEVDSPAPTVTGKDRFGLVTVTIEGQAYAIVDIGMRMLRPRELARAQGFPDTYELTGTNTNQVERIGNSVPPHLAMAMVKANYSNQVETQAA